VDEFATARLAIGSGFLLVAAIADLRTRKVRDTVWIALGSIGIVVLAVQLVLQPTDLAAWSLLGSAAILFYAIFFGAPLFGEDGFRLRPARLLLFLLALSLFVYPAAAVYSTGSKWPPGVLELYSMPAMVVVYQAFYRFRVLHGGADTKALIALGLLVPTYPDAAPFPLFAVDPTFGAVLRAVFPFSLVVWVNAALLSLAVPAGLLIANALRRDLAFPQALLGYRARIDPFPAHTWLMEKVRDDGEHVLVLYPKRGPPPTEDLARLRAAGVDRAWVTPQTPFMVPLLVGFVLAFFVGNLLIAILGLGR